MRTLRRRLDAVVLIGIALAGFGAIVAGALGAADADRAAYAVPYVASGGLVGVALVAFASCVLVLGARRRADAREVAQIEALTDVVNRRLAEARQR
jgi:hypothetical protein